MELKKLPKLNLGVYWSQVLDKFHHFCNCLKAFKRIYKGLEGIFAYTRNEGKKHPIDKN